MVISHLAMDYIQVGGLILGLLGFFYLSLGFFGSRGMIAVRSLLPAMTLGLVYILAQRVASPAKHPAPAYIVLAFASGYGLGIIYSPEYAKSLKHYLNFDLFILQAIFTAVLLVGAILIQIVDPSPNWVGRLALLLAFLGPTFIGPRLTKPRLQLIGFYLSGIAILTQFAPPVLDLLGIQVK